MTILHPFLLYEGPKQALFLTSDLLLFPTPYVCVASFQFFPFQPPHGREPRHCRKRPYSHCHRVSGETGLHLENLGGSRHCRERGFDENGYRGQSRHGSLRISLDPRSLQEPQVKRNEPQSPYTLQHWSAGHLFLRHSPGSYPIPVHG